MTQPAKAQEPSMEEILASIRRMIADDDPKPAVRKVMERELARSLEQDTRPATETVRMPTRSPVERHMAPQKPTLAAASLRDNIVPLSGGEVLDLNESMENVPDPAVLPPVFRRPLQEPRSEPRIESRAESRTDSRSESKSTRQNGADSPLGRPPFLSQSTVSAVESAFGALTSTVMNNNARTVDDLVKEMLRPMLKSWLDDNLPRLVERLVKAEIERVSRGM